MKINKIKVIYDLLNQFDTYRSTNNHNKLISDLSILQVEIRAIISISTNEVFTDILNHIELDVNYEIEKVYESLENIKGSIR